jgi:hypothetical protein
MERMQKRNEGKAKPMKDKKTKSKSNYPKEFRSGMMDTGSRTIDSGHELVVTVDDGGFSASRDCGEFSTDDLFGELGYWPSEVTWTRKGPLLSELLRQLANECGLGERKLRKIVNDYFLEYEEVDLSAYMTKELKRAKSPKSLAEFHRENPFELEHTQVPGIPSPEVGPKTFRNGLEISFHGSEWECELFSDGDGCGVELFNPQCWHADTFDELFQATDDYGSNITDSFDWDQAELAQILIDDDPRWRPFVESSSPPGQLSVAEPTAE